MDTPILIYPQYIGAQVSNPHSIVTICINPIVDTSIGASQEYYLSYIIGTREAKNQKLF